MSETEKKIETEILLLSANQAAAILNLSRSHFYGLMKIGRIPSPVRLGKVARWPRSELEAWIAAGCPAADIWVSIKEKRCQYHEEIK